MINGNALAQVEPAASGIHLFWMGPFSWVFSPGGWNIQRRSFTRRNMRCEAINAAEIGRIRNEREWRLSFGWLSYSTGSFDANTPAEVFRLDLDQPTTTIRLNLQAKLGISFALYQGKVVSAVSPKGSGSFSAEFMATAIDAVVCYLLDPQSIQYCIYEPRENEEQDWQDVPFLVKGLQLPIAELDPALQNPDDEFALAKSRLLPGEDLEPEEFRHLMDLLRPTVKELSSPRPIDKIVLIRPDETTTFEELNATAPLLSLISHPKWRRVMGFGWLDQDSALQQGQRYEYRLTGFFPLEDLKDKVYGFHTVTSNTVLPGRFFLHDLMLRFAQPPRVELAPGTPTDGTQQLSRRGIMLQPPDQFFWTFPAINDWSLVLDFPFPVQQVRLELAKGHSLETEAWDYTSPVTSGQQVPPGEVVTLTFPSPIVQLRLKGFGFLFTIRIAQDEQGVKPVSVVLPPVLFENTPRPGAPSTFQITNLQEIAAANTLSDGITTAASRSALGFQLAWEASLQNGLPAWPPGETTPPPVESTLYEIEHRQLPLADWVPILPDENWMIGHRRASDTKAVIHTGADLMQLFPEAPTAEPSANLQMHWDDVFDFSTDGTPVLRPLPELGTKHQYRIRAVDIIGRASTTWKESNQAELRKFLPPPVPVGPILTANDEIDYSVPSGVHARLLVKDAPDLTADEIAMLGSDSNIILLRWGWHPEQREIDPLAREFRVYRRNDALDSIAGQLVSVTTLSNGRFEAAFQLESPLRANAVVDTMLDLGGYPFYVRSHEAGSAVKMVIERRVPDANGKLSPPAPGAVSIPVPVGSDRMQPQGWSARIGVVPITNTTAYQFELRNALNLTADHPKDELWVGVSASDDQPYIDDKLAPAENRKGNESPIVPVRVQGRFQGRPHFEIPPPIDDVPRLLTREPEIGQVRFEINPADFLPPGTLSGVTRIRLERADAGTIFSLYGVSDDNRVMAFDPTNKRPPVEVTIPNPDDRAAILAALSGVDASSLADRYLVFLAGMHPYRASFFEPVTADPVAPGTIPDNFLPQTNRFVYRIRAGNAAGLISAGDAVLAVVVRVPSRKPGPVPELLPRRNSTPPGTIQIRVAPDESTTHLVIFYHQAPSDAASATATASLLRIANRPDLYPDRLLRFRSSSGEFAHSFVKDLSDSDVVVDETGAKIVTYSNLDDPGSILQIWACTLTSDGIPSEPAGPWRLIVPVAQP